MARTPSCGFKAAGLILTTLLVACGGSGGNPSATGGNNPANDPASTTGSTVGMDGTDTGAGAGTGTGTGTGTDTSTGTTPSADLVSASTLPTLDAERNIVWPFAPVPGDIALEVTPFAELPLALSGRAPRINDMFHGGGRLFVLVEQDGFIYDITDGTASVWFDVAAAVRDSQGRQLDVRNAFHGGLRSAAFHPEFANNGKLYVSLMEQRPADSTLHTYLSDPGTPIDADSVVVEWNVNPDTMTVDTTSYREVFRIGVPEYDHPIKQLEFNPHATPGDVDYGLLYIGHGDGSVMSTTARGGQNNDALGKVVRIDPLASNDLPYRIPADNPFVGDPNMLDEVYSIGHRNPHHLAFAPDGTLFVADAGRDNIDEINIATPAGNYGWADREGAYLQLPEGSVFEGIAELPADDSANAYTYPAVQFGHNGKPGEVFVKQAIVGGPVLTHSDGSSIYLYSEFVTSGDVFYSRVSDMQAAVTEGLPTQLTVARTFRMDIQLDHDGDASTEALARNSLLDVIDDAPGYDNRGRSDTRLGTDAAGNLYVMNKRNNIVYRARLVAGP